MHVTIMDCQGEVDYCIDRWYCKGTFKPLPKGHSILLRKGDRLRIIAGNKSWATISFVTSTGECHSVSMVRECSCWEFVGTDSDGRVTVKMEPGVCNVSLKQFETYDTGFVTSTPRLVAGVRD